MIIVNAIHVFFPGHTWVRHCLSSNFCLTLLLCLFQPHLCKDTKIYRFWRNRNSPRSYFRCSWEVTVSDRVRPRQTVSDRVRPCHSEFSCSAPAQLLSGRTDPRGAKAGALAGAVRLCKSCSAEIAEVLTATRLMMLNPSIIISQARWTHDIYIYIYYAHTHIYT